MSEENVVNANTPVSMPSDGQPEVVQPQTEQVVAPVSGTPEYDQMMAAKGAAALNTYEQNVPDKFKKEDGSVDLESLAKSYIELEKQFHAKPQEEKVIPPEVQEIAEKQEFRIPEIKKEEVVEEDNTPMTSLDYKEWGAELARTGQLSEETRNGIKAKTNLSDEMLNDWVLAQRSRNKEHFVTAANMVGGTERLSSVLNWATNNLTPEQSGIVNERLAGPDYEITLNGLVNMYDKAMANAPKTQEPVPPQNRAPAPSGRSIVEGFPSYGQFQQARSDPRYMQDSVYRQAVEERMVKTNWQSLPR